MFASIVLILVAAGIALFGSASLGQLAEAGAPIWRTLISQLAFGIIPGIAALAFFRFLPGKRLAQLVVPFYIVTIIATLAVFIPGVGLTLNGATRWIDLGITTIQPGEFLKVSVVLMLAAYLAHAKDKIGEWRTGLVPFGVIVGVPSAILLMQPNTSTVLVIGAACAAMYFLAGAPWRDFVVILLGGALVLAILVHERPYLKNRVNTFINPAENAQTTGYHIQQSLIAIGSGGITGRGYGQSVQKFNYLPEARSDSVFAVYGEEFGFIGSVLLVLLFVAFALRGFIIAGESATLFGSLAVTGLTLLIAISAFLNIGALLGVMPLTGLPLPFISQGGTALMAALASVGIILNVASRKSRRQSFAAG